MAMRFATSFSSDGFLRLAGASATLLDRSSFSPIPLVMVAVSYTHLGVNLYMDMPISFGQAALGCELEVPTLDGKVKYSIPAGTQSGTVFRLRDKGIKYLRQQRNGDLFVKMNVEIPRKLTDKQKELILEFEGIAPTKEHKKGKGIFKK